MESYSIQAVLSAVDRDFTSTMQSAEKSMDNLEKDTKKTNTSILDIAKGVGVFKLVDAGVGMVRNSLGGAISRFDTLNKYPTVMQALGYSAGEVNQSMEKLSDGIDGLPTSLDEIVASTQQFAISTGNLEKGTDTAIALNNAFLASGASSADAARGAEQYRQVLARGEVDMESWRSILETMPIGMDKVAKSFRDQGVTSTNELYDALKGGSITIDEFNNRLIELNEGVGGFADLAQKNSKGIATSFANIKTAIVKNVEKVIRAFDEGLQSAGLGSIAENLDKLKTVINDVFAVIIDVVPPAIKTFTEIVKAVKPFTPAIIGMAAALATLKFAALVSEAGGFLGFIKSVTTSTKVWTAAQTALNLVMEANPIVLVVTAIVGLIAAIVYLWNTNEGFRNAVLDVWDTIKQAFLKTADWVLNTWGTVKQFFSDLWKSIKETAVSAVDGVKNAWSGTKKWFGSTWQNIKDGAVDIWNGTVSSAKAAVQSVKDAWTSVKDWFKNTFESIKSSVTDFFSRLKDFIMPYIQPLVGAMQRAFYNAGVLIGVIWRNMVNVAKNVFTILKNVILAPVLFVTSYISGGWEEAKNNMIAVWDNIKNSAKEIWNSITESIASAVFVVNLTIRDTWNALKETLSNIWMGISQKAAEIWEGIKTYFINLWTDTKENAIQLWTSTKEAIIQTWTNTKEGAVQLWESIKTYFATTWDNLKKGAAETWENIKKTAIDTWEGIKRFFKETLDNIVKAASTAWETLKKNVSETIHNIEDTFEKLRNIDLYQVGKDIINGLVKGIKETIKDVGDAVSDVAKTVTDKIKNILDINSPSRVMQKIGVFTSQGLANGITDGSKYVEKATDILSDKAMPEIDLNQNIARANNRLDGHIQHAVNLNESGRSATFNIRFGNQKFKAFVDDISAAMSGDVDINLSF
ncbi:tape measure protein [Erwinia sp. CPCC 100877]|nr:tape measure protein [Erwinia sp. CPCC 100877]